MTMLNLVARLMLLKPFAKGLRRFAFGLGVLLLVQSVWADTVVSGVLTQNTTWYANQSPYVMSADVIIDNGATLTIEPGTTVRAAAGVNLVIQNGGLNAVGTLAAPITFTSSHDQVGSVQTPAAGDWGQLRFLGGNEQCCDKTGICYG